MRQPIQPPGKRDAEHMRAVSGEVTAVDREGKTITEEGIIILVDEEMLVDLKKVTGLR